MDSILLDGKTLRADTIPFPDGSKLLLIQGTRGMLACGYLNLETAEKLGHAMAIVTGVSNYDDMLNKEVRKVSSAASALGVTPGMTGRDALQKMNE